MTTMEASALIRRIRVARVILTDRAILGGPSGLPEDSESRRRALRRANAGERHPGLGKRDLVDLIEASEALDLPV